MEIFEKLKDIEMRLDDHDEQIFNIMETINRLLTPPERPLKKIGFQVKEKVIRCS